MIPLKLQDYLEKKELPELFENFTLKDTNGNQAPLNIYPQYLPQKNKNKNNSHFPFLTIILVEGEEQNDDAENLVKILFLCGVYDEDENNQGYRDSMNVIQKLYTNFKRKKILDNKYTFELPVKWMTNDDVTYPYFYAGLETYWSVGKIQQNNKNIEQYI